MKTILLRNRIKEEKIVQHHVEQAFLTKSTHNWKISLCFQGWLVDPSPPVVVYRKTFNLYKKFQFIATQYFVEIVDSRIAFSVAGISYQSS